MKKETKATLDQ
jgi:Arc/MetJ-type ribon-helix-helix transcriptional regulator